MAYDNGKQIRPFDTAQSPTSIGVRIAGERKSVAIHHVSRETLNKSRRGIVQRDIRRDNRRARMRLRKLRGWR